MKPVTLLMALAFAGLFSCSSEPDGPPPVNEYLVVGNDKGFRDDFINQANLVTVSDSSLAVRSLRSADNVRTYPIVNGYLEGGADPALHWRYDTIGQDTITLTDTSRANVFYLHRLRRVDSIPTALGLLTSGELTSHAGAVVPDNGDIGNNFVFNDMGQAAGCLINRGYYGYRDWTKMVGNAESGAMPPVEYYLRSGNRSSLWRLYRRFVQPILVYDNYNSGLTVIPLDSVSAGRDTLYGRSITDRSFRIREDVRLYRRDTSRGELDAEYFTALPDLPDRVERTPEKIKLRHRRRWEEAYGLEEKLTIYEDDMAGLRLLFLAGNRLVLRNDEKVFLSTEYTLHESAPYLVVEDQCDNNAYWHYSVTDDSLTLRVPLRVDVTPPNGKPEVMEINGKKITIPAGRWYINEEWRATYALEEQTGK